MLLTYTTAYMTVKDICPKKSLEQIIYCGSTCVKLWKRQTQTSDRMTVNHRAQYNIWEGPTLIQSFRQARKEKKGNNELNKKHSHPKEYISMVLFEIFTQLLSSSESLHGKVYFYFPTSPSISPIATFASYIFATLSIANATHTGPEYICF